MFFLFPTTYLCSSTLSKRLWWCFYAFYFIAKFMSWTITDRFHSLLGNCYFQITIFSLCVLLEEVDVSDKHAHSGTTHNSYCTWAASLAKTLSQSLLVSNREIQSGESAPALSTDDWHMEQNDQYFTKTLKSLCRSTFKHSLGTNILSRVLLYEMQLVNLRLRILWS